MSESDPLGKDPHEAGAKLDGGKIKPRLIIMDMANALSEVSKIATFGAEKYTERGWLSVPDADKRYLDAMIRHLLAEGKGEEIDPDSKLLHSAHLAWNALARLELKLRT